MQLIKIPTTSCVNATLKRWGHDFIRNREGKYSKPWANGVDPNVKRKTHKAINYLFCLIHPIIYFFHKLVEVVNALGCEEYGSQLRIGEATHFWKSCFWLMGQVNAQKCMPKPLFTHTFFSLTWWELPVCFPSRFRQFIPFSPGLGSRFCNAQWLGSLLHIFPTFLHFHGWENPFLYCWVNVQHRFTIWGF